MSNMTASKPYTDLQVGDEVLTYLEWPSEVGHKKVGRRRVPDRIIPPGDVWCRITKVDEPRSDGTIFYWVEPIDPAGANVMGLNSNLVKEARHGSPVVGRDQAGPIQRSG